MQGKRGGGGRESAKGGTYPGAGKIFFTIRTLCVEERAERRRKANHRRRQAGGEWKFRKKGGGAGDGV